MARYNCYIKQRVRAVPSALDVDLDTAIVFLECEEFGVVTDSKGKQLKLKELKNAKSLGSKSGVGKDSTATSFGALSEGTDRKLSEPSTDNSE